MTISSTNLDTLTAEVFVRMREGIKGESDTDLLRVPVADLRVVIKALTDLRTERDAAEAAAGEWIQKEFTVRQERDAALAVIDKAREGGDESGWLVNTEDARTAFVRGTLQGDEFAQPALIVAAKVMFDGWLSNIRNEFAATPMSALADRDARIWDEGFKQGGPMHDDDGTFSHRINPYRAASRPREASPHEGGAE